MRALLVSYMGPHILNQNILKLNVSYPTMDLTVHMEELVEHFFFEPRTFIASSSHQETLGRRDLALAF
jgi:hypothetical protein